MDKTLELELAIAQAYARGKQEIALTARVKRSRALSVRGTTPEEIIRRMATLPILWSDRKIQIIWKEMK
jgi:hypothetical protein